MVETKKVKKIDFKYNLKLYFNLFKKYKFPFALLMILILYIEITHVIDDFIFKILVDRGAEFFSGVLAREEYIKILLILAFVFILMVITKIVVKWFNMHLINKLDVNLIFDLKRKFFNHLIHLSYDFHTSNKTGSLISKLIRGSSAIEMMTDVIVFNIAPLIFQLIVAGASLLYFDITSAIIVLLIVVSFISYSFFINSIQQESNIKANETEDIERANISDIFTNIDSIKSFGKEFDIKKRYKLLGEKTKEAFLKNWNYFRWLDSGQSLILTTGTFFLVLFPLLKFLDKKITLGTLVFIYAIYGNMMGPLYGFVHGMRNFYRAIADFESLFQYSKIENEIKDLPNAKELKIKHGEIEFKNISFKYKRKGIFSNFNLKIPENKKVALVGPSGCGKTTLIKLLYRLYDVEEGEILIDKKNIKNFKQESLRSELSIVPQECILFDDTIYNNIAFSRPNASKEEVLRAIKFAQLDGIINQFPNKEDTIVGERGVKLSGGEKQRVSIARAILADKKVLVLDEATSSLDSKVEYDIQQALGKLMQERTSIIIAHRLSTIINSDIIVVMDKGKIIQIGAHEQLIKEDGLYKKLWDMQKGGYIK